MNKMYLFLAVFIIVSVFHITVILLRKENLRRISKCFLMPLLLAVYIASGEHRYIFIVPALILGWIGDALLIKIEKKAHFILGLASFLLGHVCYMITFIQILGLSGNVNIPAIAVFIAPAILLGMVVFRLIKPTKEMFFPVILYMAVLVAMNFLGFQVFLLNTGIAGILILSGCYNFIVSDTILAYYTFRKVKLWGAVLLMIFYILAQAEIVMGLMKL